MDVTTIAVPVAYTAILMHLFEALKVYVLEPYVPGFRAQDSGHDQDLRVLFFLLVFASTLGFVLSGQAGVPTPTTWYEWLGLVYVMGNTALALMAGAHVTYQALWSNGPTVAGSGAGDPAVPADYPPRAPSVEALGLPTTAESA